MAMTLPGGAAVGSTISGTTYRDVDADGTHDSTEPAQGGITVTATDGNGGSVTTVSAASGGYSLDVSGLSAGLYRLEFSGWPAGLRPGPNGANNPTSVVVAAKGAANVDFGVIDPAGYCQANPKLVVTCFVAGTNNGTGQTLTQFNSEAGAKESSAHDPVPGPPNYNTPAAVKLASLGDTGSIYGEGYHAPSGSMYLGAFAKKYVPLGGAGSGAIYLRRANGTLSVFWSTGSAANRTPTTPGNWYTDPWYGEITKTGWGDVDVLGNRLYAVNLEDRSLYVFELDPATGALVGKGPIGVYPIPASAKNPADSRPFGLGVRANTVYVGGVDSGETSLVTPSGWVRSFDPVTNTFAPGLVTSFGLGFERGCVDVAKTAITGRCTLQDGSAKWRRWGETPSAADTTALDPVTNLPTGQVIRTQVDPQPILSDIVFDSDGSMMIGMRDRYGDQGGRRIPGGTVPNPLNPALGNYDLFIDVYAMGDTLRLSTTDNATWTLESNGVAGTKNGTTHNSGMGPGGGEFYGADGSLFNTTVLGTPTLVGHDEVTMGGLAYLPQTDELATTAYDVFGKWDNLGTKYLTDTGADAANGADSTDLNNRAFSLYKGTLGGDLPFGKTNGLGDLEAICAAAPLEIGNYVWFDANENGIQDSGELPIGGVTVRLRNSGGTLLATAVTNPLGQYFFVSAGAPNLPPAPIGPEYGVVAGGITPATDYQVDFDISTANRAPLGAVGILSPTTPVVGPSRTIDSNPVLQEDGTVRALVTTGGPGSNDHTIDSGWKGQFRVTTTSQGATTTAAGATSTTSPTQVSVLGTSTIPGGVSVQSATSIAGVSVQDQTLAFTGNDSPGVLAFGSGMVLLGLGLMLSSRRRNPA